MRVVSTTVILTALLTACGTTDSAAVHAFQGETMGTTYSIKVAAPAMTADGRRAVERAVADVLDRIDRSMSTWRPDSELSRFNASPSTESTKVSDELLDVLECAQRVSEESGGTFDVTVGPLVEAWGFGPKGRPARRPTDDEVADIRARVGNEKLIVDRAAGAIRKTVPGLTVDVGAIAPGYGSDRVGGALEKLGYRNYMVELGGEVRARGRKPDGAAWVIGIEQPDDDGRVVRRAVALADASLSTSGDYRDYYEEEDVRYSHTIDPRTGSPIAHNLASVSVVCDECMWADAYATAVDVLGPDAGYDLAVERKLPALFIMRESAGVFRERATPEFERRFGGG